MILHQTCGRIRIRLCASIDFPRKSAVLREDLLLFDGVKQVTSNEYTKTVLVTFDPKRMSVEKIMQVVARTKALGNLYFLPFAWGQNLAPKKIHDAQRNRAQDEWITEFVAAVSLHLMRTLVESALSGSGKLILRKLKFL